MFPSNLYKLKKINLSLSIPMEKSKPQHNSRLIGPQGLFGLICALAFASIFYIFTHQALPDFVQIERPKVWNFEAQMKIFVKFAFFVGLIIFVNSIMIAQIRVFQWKVEPQKGQQEDTPLINILNQSLRNHVEQAIPFLTIYLYWLVYKAKEDDIKLAYCFGFFFVVYRVIFFLGYITGVFLKTSLLRGFGFGGSAFITLLLITKSFGINLVCYCKKILCHTLVCNESFLHERLYINDRAPFGF